MRVPKSELGLLNFARDQIQACCYSQATRSSAYSSYLAYYERGTDKTKPALYNRMGVHIDRSSSYLYGPGGIRFLLGYDANEGEPWLERGRIASKYLSRKYRKTDADMVFSQGVSIALIKGCGIMKHNWLDDDSLTPGFDPQLVHPEFFGVEREDIEKLEAQQSMVHTYYLSKEQVRQLVANRPDEKEVLNKVKTLGGVPEDNIKRNWLHQMVLGGVTPVGTLTDSGSTGQVSISPSSMIEFSPEILENLLRVDELWVLDDAREDYTTLQLLEGELFLEGKYRHRNLCGLKGMHPFSRICPDPVSGYFWGRSEVERTMVLQDLLNESMDNIRRLMKLRVRPPKGLIGFTGVTQAKMRAALAPGGTLLQDNPNAKIQDLIPQIPQELFQDPNAISEMFDEVGGFKPILTGHGEPGVRANVHARTLMRTASPKLRERALRVERDAESSAAITFRLFQAKDARVFGGKDEKDQFTLKQIPDDWYLEVDSHSGSPVFIEDAREEAFALNKIGAASPEDVVEMIHPPMEQKLISGIKEREAFKRKLYQEHPELMAAEEHKRHR